MSIETWTDRQALEALAAELNERFGMRAEVSAAPGEVPFLKATNARMPILNERITIAAEHYRWSWGDPIGPISDPKSAAAHVIRVIRER